MGYKRVIRSAKVHLFEIAMLLLSNAFCLSVVFGVGGLCMREPALWVRVLFGLVLALLAASVIAFVGVVFYCVVVGLRKEDGGPDGYKPMVLTDFVGRQVEIVRVPECVGGLSVGDAVYVMGVGYLHDGGAGVKVKDRDGMFVWLSVGCVRLLW